MSVTICLSVYLASFVLCQHSKCVKTRNIWKFWNIWICLSTQHIKAVIWRKM